MSDERRPTLTVLYDDRCPMCTFQSRLLTRLDWSGRIVMMPLCAPEAGPLAGDIDQARLREAIHCFEPSGRVFRGARALRHIGMRLPLMVPLALLLWVPGVILLAEQVYGSISRNRHRLSRWFGCTTACRLLPDRKNEPEAAPPAERREQGLNIEPLEDRTHF